MTLEDRILRLARLGMTPYQIEEQLGIKHFHDPYRLPQSSAAGLLRKRGLLRSDGRRAVKRHGYREVSPDRSEEGACQRDAD